VKAPVPLFVLFVGVSAGFASSLRTPPHAEVNFDRDVRPILSEHCFRCHGPDVGTAAAGLRLDSFKGATKDLGGEAAVVPGDPSKSVLLQRVSANPSERMPPSDSGVQPLSTAQIETLKEWIQSGAHYDKHWSFVPPQLPPMPTVSNPAWCKNSVDRFVLAKLDDSGMKPEPEADRDTLAMRAAETLTGLPPTMSELAAFRGDKRPGAYERYVDRLMAKPAYGEQEARYWLDAVRYGDTHGLQLDNERGIYPYRDWVVRAFNQDLPYNKFVKWQLAGDLLPNPTTEQLVATGYVRMNLTSNEGGAIPEEFLARNTFDRVDTTSTVLLGLTAGCAKCHDHKYDPISQRDYYGLYAFFDSTQDKPLDDNILLPAPYIRASTPDQEAELAKMQAGLDLQVSAVDLKAAVNWIVANRDPVPASRDWQISPVYSAVSFDAAFDTPYPGEPGQKGDGSWKPFKYQLGMPAVGIIGKDNASVYVKGTITVPAAKTMTLRVSSDDGVRLWLNGKLIHSHKVGRSLDDIDIVKAGFKAGDNELVAKIVNSVEPDGMNIRMGDPERAVVDELAAKPNDLQLQKEVKVAYLTATSPGYTKLVKAKSDFESSIPMTLIAREMATPRPTYVLKRGQYDQKGDLVQRHIPAAIGSLPTGVKADRLSLADWMISPQNPLVARVFVNRAWQQFFGTGIVKTPEDFGSQGEWPVNQPLLDYLAVKFEKDGWSVKALNRLIVTSAAFRQSSRVSPLKLAKDPENRLISRGPRFRLDAEEIRDKALEDAGLLSSQVGGHGFKPYQPDGIWESSSDPASSTHVYVRDHGRTIYRRSMYMFWKRTSPPPAMVTLDAPLRDTCVVRRSTTDTPLQALAVLNETGFLEASRVMAERIAASPGDDRKRLDLAYQVAMGRPPTPFESNLLLKAVLRYRTEYQADPTAAEKLVSVGDSVPLKTVPAAERATWMIVCSSIMNTNEYLSLH